MTKHYCDKCGKEILPSEKYPVRNIEIKFKSCYEPNPYYYELCNDCAAKVINFIESKANAPDPLTTLDWDGNVLSR